jgi:hypothetical protein
VFIYSSSAINISETCIRIMQVILGKGDRKTSLNETDLWTQKGGETTYETDDETEGETCKK